MTISAMQWKGVFAWTDRQVGRHSHRDTETGSQIFVFPVRRSCQGAGGVSTAAHSVFHEVMKVRESGRPVLACAIMPPVVDTSCQV